MFGFFEVFVGLDLKFGLGPSDERVAVTSFKAVVRDPSDLGAATLELRGMDGEPSLTNLGINCQQVLFPSTLHTSLAAWPTWWLITTIFRKNIRHPSS